MSQPKVLQLVHYYANTVPVAEVRADVVARFEKYCAQSGYEFEGGPVVSVEPALYSTEQTRATVRAWKKPND